MGPHQGGSILPSSTLEVVEVRLGEPSRLIGGLNSGLRILITNPLALSLSPPVVRARVVVEKHAHVSRSPLLSQR